MADPTNEPEVKLIDRVEIDPAGDDEETVEPETEPQTDSSQEKKDDKGEKNEPETEEGTPEPEEPEADKATEPEPVAEKTDEGKTYAELKRIPGETPREWALRLQNAQLRDQLRGNQKNEILTPPPVQPVIKKEPSPEKKKILEKYKPEDIKNLKEVFDVMAEDMGFVKQSDLGARSWNDKAADELDNFLDKHPEYQPKNDAGGLLWKAFGEEYRSGMYNTRPENPKHLGKILEKVHKEVFGIQPTAALNKQEAAKEKIKVASHSGSSKPSPRKEGIQRSVAPQGLRMDMLKGFSEDEIAEMLGE